MSDPYSATKASWHADRIAELRAGRDIAPIHVQMVLSDLCNQDCHFCAYRMETGFTSSGFAEGSNRNPARFIPRAKALEILEDCAEIGVKAVQFTGGGEPTVHPDHIEIIGRAQELGLETALVTNGVKLKDHPVFHNLEWLRISLDAGTPETYERIRRSKQWPKAMSAIKLGAELDRPYYGVGFVVTRENWQEVALATEIAATAGADYIRLAAMFSTDGSDYYGDLLPEIDAQREAAKAIASRFGDFKVVDLFGDRIADLDQGAPDYKFCGEQQFTLYLGGDQKVYRCCTMAYTSHGLIGDLRDQRLRDWIKSSNRFSFDARSCHHCQFNDKNRAINKLLFDPPPMHVNFT
jgi:MoaA/NifB/PqqE/SkfB family radical SAM enzyme